MEGEEVGEEQVTDGDAEEEEESEKAKSIEETVEEREDVQQEEVRKC